MQVDKNEADANVLALEAQAFVEQRTPNSLARSWFEAGIDSEIMRDELTSLIAGTNQYLWPLIQFRHPEALYPLGADLDPTIEANARALTAVSLSDTLLGAPGKGTLSKAQVVLNLVGQVTERIQDASWLGDAISYAPPSGGNERQLYTLTVTLPRPGHPPPGARTSVDPVRAGQFWQALVDPNRTVAEVAIDLGDVYDRFNAAGLNSNELAPIIHRMTIYAHLDNQRQAADLNIGLRSELRTSATVLVPTHRGPEMYRLDEALRGFSAVPLIFGRDEFSPALVLDQGPAGLGGRGLSLFTTFELMTSFVRYPQVARVLPNIRAISLVFLVDFQQASTEPDWLTQVCK